MNMMLNTGLAATLAIGALMLPANATTLYYKASGGDSVDYTDAGLTFGDPRIQNGSCANSNSIVPCMALSLNQILTLTSIADRASFRLSSLGFELLSDSPAKPMMSNQARYGKNDNSLTFNLAGNSSFNNVASLNFSNNGEDNVPVDVIGVAAVPLPVTGLLLMGGLGALAAFCRKGKTAW